MTFIYLFIKLIYSHIFYPFTFNLNMTTSCENMEIKDSYECSICLNNLQSCGTVKTNCNHIFCVTCIIKHSHSKNGHLCPMCRQEYVSDNTIKHNDLTNRFRYHHNVIHNTACDLMEYMWFEHSSINNNKRREYIESSYNNYSGNYPYYLQTMDIIENLDADHEVKNKLTDCFHKTLLHDFTIQLTCDLDVINTDSIPDEDDGGDNDGDNDGNNDGNNGDNDGDNDAEYDENMTTNAHENISVNAVDGSSGFSRILNDEISQTYYDPNEYSFDETMYDIRNSNINDDILHEEIEDCDDYHDP